MRKALFLLVVITTATFCGLRGQLFHASELYLFTQMPEATEKHKALRDLLATQSSCPTPSDAEKQYAALNEKYLELFAVDQNDAALLDLENEIAVLEQELIDLKNAEQADLQDRITALDLPLYQKIRQSAAKVGKGHKASIIFNSTPGEYAHPILYAAPYQDLTYQIGGHLEIYSDETPFIPSPPTTPIQLGYLDFEQLIQTRPSLDSAMKAYTRVEQKANRELAVRVEYAEGKFMEWEMDTVVSGEVKAKRAHEGAKLTREIESLTETLSLYLQKKKEVLLEPELEKVNSAIQSVAEARNLSFVFDRSGPAAIPSIVAADPALDITSEVIETVETGQAPPFSTDFDPKKLRIGQVDVFEILTHLPAFKTAQQLFADYQALTQLKISKKRETLVHTQARYNLWDKNGQATTPEEAERRRQEILSLSKELHTFTREMDTQLAQKKIELTTPVYTEVFAAIEKIADDRGFDVVFPIRFEENAYFVLYGDPNYDLTGPLSFELGMTADQFED